MTGIPVKRTNNRNDQMTATAIIANVVTNVQIQAHMHVNAAAVG